MKLPKLNMGYILLFGFVAMMGYLYTTGQLTNDWFFILAVMALLAFYFGSNQPAVITYAQARKIAITQITELQKIGDVEEGTLRVMPETELKSILVKSKTPTVEPYRWEVGVEVDGVVTYGYVVFISLYGNILGTSEIDVPSNYRVTNRPDIREIGGEYEVEDVPEKDKKVKEEMEHED